MALQNKDCILIICNKKNNKSLHILVKINFPKINNLDQTEVVLQALVDIGCFFTSICKSVVPQHNCFRISIITKIRTKSEDIITNDIETRNFTIQLSTNCDIFGNKIFINKADVVDLQPTKEKMILGLDFIIHDNRSVTITKDYLLISTNSQMPPIIDELTSELRTKHGDALANTNTSNQCPCDIPGSCKMKGSQNYGRISILETPQDSYQENM